MNELEEKSEHPDSPPEASADDDRRARAAEINRKRTEDDWNQKKKAWLEANFPEKS